MSKRPPAFPATLLKRPAPAAMRRAQSGADITQKLVERIRHNADEKDVDHIEMAIVLRDRIAALGRTLDGGDIPTAQADLKKTIAVLDGWLNFHRGE